MANWGMGGWMNMRTTHFLLYFLSYFLHFKLHALLFREVKEKQIKLKIKQQDNSDNKTSLGGKVQKVFKQGSSRVRSHCRKVPLNILCRNIRTLGMGQEPSQSRGHLRDSGLCILGPRVEHAIRGHV